MTYYDFCRYMKDKGYEYIKHSYTYDVWEKNNKQYTTPVMDVIPMNIVTGWE